MTDGGRSRPPCWRIPVYDEAQRRHELLVVAAAGTVLLVWPRSTPAIDLTPEARTLLREALRQAGEVADQQAADETGAASC